jgi:predicted GNAT family acetyltransferase
MGYAFSLLYVVTEGILKNRFKKCGLLSDATNPSSNRIFIKVGYKPIYYWVYLLTPKKLKEPEKL